MELTVQVEWLAEKMLEANFTVSAMHGDMEQSERDKIMKEFRAGNRYVVVMRCVLTPFSLQPCTDHHRCVGSRSGRAAGVAGH